MDARVQISLRAAVQFQRYRGWELAKFAGASIGDMVTYSDTGAVGRDERSGHLSQPKSVEKSALSSGTGQGLAELTAGLSRKVYRYREASLAIHACDKTRFRLNDIQNGNVATKSGTYGNTSCSTLAGMVVFVQSWLQMSANRAVGWVSPLQDVEYSKVLWRSSPHRRSRFRHSRLLSGDRLCASWLASFVRRPSP